MSELAPFWLSLRVAAVATSLIVAAGVPAAWILARRDFPGKGLIAGLLILPLVLPPTVLGYYLLQVLGRRAPIGHWLESTLGITVVFHWSGAVIASAVAAFPLFLLPARGVRVGRPGAGGRRAAAGPGRDLGLPGRDAATGLARARRGDRAGLRPRLGDFGATLMVAGNIPGLTQTAALAIYDAIVLGNDAARAGRLTLLISAVSIVALLIVQRTMPSRRPAR